MPRLFCLLLLAACAIPAWAQTVAEPSPPITSRIRGVFDFDLPNIDPPGTVKLIFHPHLGDFIRRDYLRLDSGFRWALTDHFEISPGAALYFAHGLGGTNDDGYGVGAVRLGSKYILRQWPDADFETSMFLNVEVPLAGAPVDMTDGLNHTTPGFLVQHRSARNAKITTFAGAGLDLVSDSRAVGTRVSNMPRDDSMNFTAGAIYDLGQIKWTLSATYATTVGLGETTEHFYYLRPSVLWYLPTKYTFSKTRWIVGLGVRASWGPDGTEFSFPTRLRAEITFRQMLDKVLPNKPTTKAQR